MKRLLRQLGWLLRRKTREAELQEEMDFHLQSEIEERKAAGLSGEQARREAFREFGNVTLHSEDTRSTWGWSLFDEVHRDLRYGLRNLRRNPGFAAVAVGTLALGIGAATSVFSIVNGVLLESFPYRDPSHLVVLFEHLANAPSRFGVSPPDFEILRSEAKSFSGMAAYRTIEYELSGIAESRRLFGAKVSPELFGVLGVAPAIGRAISAEDDRQNASVVVLGHRLWASLGRERSVLGRTILLDRRPFTVVGVMPERFDFPPRGSDLNGEPADLFVPMAFSKFEREGFGMRYSLTVLARLKPGVSLEQARGEMKRLTQPLLERYPAALRSFISGLSIPVLPLNEDVSGGSRTMLLVLLAAVAMVLLVVCADVANLMLTRFDCRRREIAVRSSLGASPARILRQLFTESIMLGILGSALGLVIAWFAMQSLLSLGSGTLPRAESITFNQRVLLFAIALGILTPLLFGMLPALRGSSVTDAGTLRDRTRTATPGRRTSRLLGTLAITQIALALVLSVGAGLLLRSFLHLLSTDPGFRIGKAVRLTVTLPSGGYAERGRIRSFYERSIDAARTIPGVVTAAAGSDLPLGVRERRIFSAEAPARSIPELNRLIAPSWVSPGYFAALGIPLKRGRTFTSADGDKQPVVIVSEMLAEMMWPGEDPVGRRIKWGVETWQAPWMTIVGVVGNVKQGSLAAPTIGQVYVPLSLLEPGPLSRTVNVVVRSERDASSLIGDLRTALHSLDPALPAPKAQPLEEMVGESLRPQRFSMAVVTLFAAVALGLAAIGIYGVLASIVTQQTHEIALRVALGATTSRVIWMIGRRALVVIAAGVGLGVAGAWAMTRLMAGLLYEVRPTDGVAFFGAAVTLTVLAGIASLAPAWRAVRVDPLVALKAE